MLYCNSISRAYDVMYRREQIWITKVDRRQATSTMVNIRKKAIMIREGRCAKFLSHNENADPFTFIFLLFHLLPCSIFFHIFPWSSTHKSHHLLVYSMNFELAFQQVGNKNIKWYFVVLWELFNKIFCWYYPFWF